MTERKRHLSEQRVLTETKEAAQEKRSKVDQEELLNRSDIFSSKHRQLVGYVRAKIVRM